MSELRVAAVVDLEGNLSRRAQQYGRDLSRFSSSGQRSMAILRRGVSATGRTLERMGNRYTTMITGATGITAARNVIALDKRLTQLGVNTELSSNQIEKLKKNVFDIAQKREIRVDPGELLNAIDQVVAQTGRVDVAVENLENIGMLIRATGAAGADAGSMIANMFEKFGVKEAGDMLKVLDTLVRQGKEGAFEMRDLATQGNEVMAAFAATGRTGPKAVQEMGAILQMIRRTSGGAAEAATNFERLISSLTIEQVGALQKRGIKIWDEAKLKEGVKVARSIPDIIKDIVRGTKGDMEKLGDVFDIRALRALNAFVLEYKETGGFTSLDNFLAMQGEGNQLMADASRNASTADAAVTNLLTTLKGWADSRMHEPIQKLADAINDIDTEKLRDLFDVVAIGAGSLITFAAGAKAVRGIRSLIGAGKKGGGGLGGVVGDMTGVVPVFVTNPGFGGGLGKAAGAAGAGAGAAAKTGGTAAAAAGLARYGIGPGAALLGAGAVGAGIGALIYKGIENTTVADKIGAVVAETLANMGVESAVELRRFIENQKLKAQLHIKVEADKGNTVRVKELRDEYKSMDIDVDTGGHLSATVRG